MPAAILCGPAPFLPLQSRINGSLDHAVFWWNHQNTDNVIDSGSLEHAFSEKPFTLFRSML